jgi:hypothetical protein
MIPARSSGAAQCQAGPYVGEGGDERFNVVVECTPAAVLRELAESALGNGCIVM